ncbi:hypothetical protein SELMODRAFT_445727 [Selaginella moellendorffii]|uniref:Uncharacterized protein n=1 Tax=Selaginella moellendorffii TaxID=88036 RepID=D8SKR9_SELML|nr:uncharacterized protein LOC9644336 [Selaginella moellendorffii]EFJ14898.1 hypothetical protein SELMODRAFT_445727 [Selaginella moellendorffii]|eukprot:XP_002983886.1 uncharacterized protein LOC9644336 [Selaginella moellendorffii]
MWEAIMIVVSAPTSSGSGRFLLDNPIDGGKRKLNPAAAAVAPWMNPRCTRLSLVRRKAAIRSRTPEENASEDCAEQLDRLDANLCKDVAATAASAEDALEKIISSQDSQVAGRVVSNEECCEIIVAAFSHGNVDLAFSLLDAMRSKKPRIQSDQVGEAKGTWQWPQPDVSTYATVIKGLAASLRVSDAIQAVSNVRRRGVPLGDEVPFGNVVKCPTCNVAMAVVQPQCGIQLVACSKCRYQYELMSGNVTSCESESMSSSTSALERALRFLQLMKRPVASAVHSFNVTAPNGVARTHRFATESAEIPGQLGERVTIASAAPARQGFRFISFAARTPGWQPSEPMAVTNHDTGRETKLLRAPPKTGATAAAFNTSLVVPAALVLASSNAATALIDPTLPRAIVIGASAAIVFGGAANAFLLPKLNQIPSRSVDAIALRQELLSQYEMLQSRLQQLTDASVQEVVRLARMCQLENKMESVGQDMYSARIDRVRKAREGIDERLRAQLELIDNYAKIAAMIEIEVEMDMDVIAAETAGAVARIEEQIQGLMEVEELQKKWKIQAEAADEVERLLSSAPTV